MPKEPATSSAAPKPVDEKNSYAKSQKEVVELCRRPPIMIVTIIVITIIMIIVVISSITIIMILLFIVIKNGSRRGVQVAAPSAHLSSP